LHGVNLQIFIRYPSFLCAVLKSIERRWSATSLFLHLASVFRRLVYDFTTPASECILSTITAIYLHFVKISPCTAVASIYFSLSLTTRSVGGCKEVVIVLFTCFFSLADWIEECFSVQIVWLQMEKLIKDLPHGMNATNYDGYSISCFKMNVQCAIIVMRGYSRQRLIVVAFSNSIPKNTKNTPFKSPATSTPSKKFPIPY